MFDVCCKVDDKKLVAFLKALDGLIVGEPKIRIVRGAKVAKGKVVSAQPVPGGDVTANLAKLIYDRQLEVVDSEGLRGLLKDAGASTASFSHYAKKLQDLKVLGKGKRGRGYKVLSAAAAVASNGAGAH